MLNVTPSPMPAPAGVRSGSIWANFPSVHITERLQHPAYNEKTGSKLRQFTSSMMLYPQQSSAVELLLDWAKSVHVHVLGTSCGDLMEYWAQRLAITHGKKAALTGVEQHRGMWMIAQQRQYVFTQYEREQANAYGQGHPLSDPYFSQHFQKMEARPPWFSAAEGTIADLNEMVKCPLTGASVANGKMAWYQPYAAVKKKQPTPQYHNMTVQDYLKRLVSSPPTEAQHVVVGNNTLGHLSEADFCEAFQDMAQAFKGKPLWVLTDAREAERFTARLAQSIQTSGFSPVEEQTLRTKNIPNIPGWVEVRESNAASYMRPQNIWGLNVQA